MIATTICQPNPPQNETTQTSSEQNLDPFPVPRTNTSVAEESTGIRPNAPSAASRLVDIRGYTRPPKLRRRITRVAKARRALSPTHIGENCYYGNKGIACKQKADLLTSAWLHLTKTLDLDLQIELETTDDLTIWIHFVAADIPKQLQGQDKWDIIRKWYTATSRSMQRLFDRQPSSTSISQVREQVFSKLTKQVHKLMRQTDFQEDGDES